MAALTIARLTIREAARRKLLLALALLTLIVIGLTGWGFQHLSTLTTADGTPIPASELRLATSQVLVLVEFMFSAVLALSAVVVASPSISSEVESGVALAILARPVSRYQVVLGKWLGFAALILVYVGATTALELLVVAFTNNYVPPGPVGLGEYIGGEGFGNAGISNAGTVSQLLLPTDALWRGSVYELEPVVYRAVLGGSTERAGNPFFVQAPPSAAFLVWTACWVVLILSLAVWSFRRREV